LQRCQGAIQLPPVGGHHQDRLRQRTALRLVVRLRRMELQTSLKQPIRLPNKDGFNFWKQGVSERVAR
jgi:hypothetical protein